MVIDNLDVVTVAIAPYEANPPLVVNANGVPALAIAAQSLEAISRRRRQHRKFGGGMELQQFPQRHALEGPEATGMLIVKKLLGFLRREALDHSLRVLRSALYVKRSFEHGKRGGRLRGKAAARSALAGWGQIVKETARAGRQDEQGAAVLRPYNGVD